MEQASNQEQEARRLFEQFAQQVRTQLLPLYDRLQSQLAQHLGLQRRMEKLAATMHKLAAKLRYHETATNVFVRFFTGLLYKFRRNRLRKLPGQLAQLRGEEQLLMQAYRQDYAAYLAQQARLKNGPYLALQQMREQLAATMQTLAQKPHYDPSRDIWGLFTGSAQQPVNDSAGIAALRNRLQADMTRAKGLGKTLQDWQRDMADKQNYALGEIILESVSLVGATCIGVNSQRRFADLDFDVTIIDEAGQIQIHNALVPMSVSGKVIMLGDHKQIPPQQDPELEALCAIQNPPVDPSLLRMSLFEWLYDHLPESNKRILDTQYRIPGQIADIISNWFYDSKYLTFQNKLGLSGVLTGISDSPFVIIDTSGCDKRYETPQNKSYFNDLEAIIAAALVQHITKQTEIDLSEIGVVSAQKPQTARIRQKIATFLPRDVVDGMVATLDSFQGQERDVIIFCFTRSSSKPAHVQRIGFLKELRRLNVAMTRAKKTLVLIGDMEFLSSCTCRTDKFGNLIEDSEQRFSEFIQAMLTAVENGSGQHC